MIQRVLAHYQYPLLSSVGLILFLLVFVAVVIWVYRKGSPGVYAELGQLPFEGGLSDVKRD